MEDEALVDPLIAARLPAGKLARRIKRIQGYGGGFGRSSGAGPAVNSRAVSPTRPCTLAAPGRALRDPDRTACLRRPRACCWPLPRSLRRAPTSRCTRTRRTRRCTRPCSRGATGRTGARGAEADTGRQHLARVPRPPTPRCARWKSRSRCRSASPASPLPSAPSTGRSTRRCAPAASRWPAGNNAAAWTTATPNCRRCKGGCPAGRRPSPGAPRNWKRTSPASPRCARPGRPPKNWRRPGTCRSRSANGPPPCLRASTRRARGSMKRARTSSRCRTGSAASRRAPPSSARRSSRRWRWRSAAC